MHTNDTCMYSVDVYAWIERVRSYSMPLVSELSMVQKNEGALPNYNLTADWQAREQSELTSATTAAITTTSITAGECGCVHAWSVPKLLCLTDLSRQFRFIDSSFRILFCFSKFQPL